METTPQVFNDQIAALRKALLKIITPHTKQIVAVLDIEGTTTALPFVTKVLFPYAESELETFVEAMYPLAGGTRVDTCSSSGVDDGKAEVTHRAASDVELFRTSLTEATEAALNRREKNGSACRDEAAVGGAPSRSSDMPTCTACSMPTDANTSLLTPQQFIAELKARMAANSKVAYLKQIQGVIWRSGYLNGTIKGHVFADASAFIKSHEGSNRGRPSKIYASAAGVVTSSVEIYSSGSIAAQKLLFGYSTAGDLTSSIAGYHDPTTVGLKTVAESYTNLRKAVEGGLIPMGGNNGEGAVAVIFFTDSIAEVEACVASKAIDLCVFFRRPLNNPVTDAQEEVLLKRVPSIISFAQYEAAVQSVLLGGGGGISPVTEEEACGAIAALKEQVKGFEGAGELKIF